MGQFSMEISANAGSILSGNQQSRIASGEIDTEEQKEKLLEAYAEELLRKYSEWENLQMSVVAGA